GQQRFQVAEQAAHGGAVEEIAAILGAHRERPVAGRRRGHREGQLELGGAGVEHRLGGGQAGPQRQRPPPLLPLPPTLLSPPATSPRPAPSRRAPTILPNVASRWAKAPTPPARPRARSSAPVGSPARSRRSGRVLTKSPMSGSTAGRSRPSTGDPITRSSCPL